jgi:AAA ATPase domain
VGRGGELARFQANLALPVMDTDRMFVFSIHGDGGVGKSTLVRELQRIASDSGALQAAVDERVIGVPETLKALSDQLVRQGVRLPEFTKAYALYEESRAAGRGGSDAVEGWAGLLTQTAVKAGSVAAHGVPVAGAVVDAVDGERLAQQVERVAGRSRRARQARVTAAPVEVLTTALVTDVGKIRSGPTLALFFDTFEQTSAVLDPWLRALLDGRYGPMPADLVVTVAGRASLDQAVWSPLLGVIADVPLGPFTEIEARQLLAGRGITDEGTVRQILENTGRLPHPAGVRRTG